MVCGEERREPLHLGRNYYPAQQLPTNRNVAGPWALLVNVSALLRFQRCLEAETNRLEEADRTPYQLNPKTLRNLLDDRAKLENIIKYNHEMSWRRQHHRVALTFEPAPRRFFLFKNTVGCFMKALSF